MPSYKGPFKKAVNLAKKAKDKIQTSIADYDYTDAAGREADKALGLYNPEKLSKRSRYNTMLKENEVAPTPGGMAKYADKPPKINLRKAYEED
jgi:hypothetical protein